MLAGNAAGVVDCMPEDVVAAFGRSFFIDAMREMRDGAEKEGITIEKVHIALPSDMAMVEDAGERARIFAVVPQTVVMKTVRGRIQHRSFLIGVSSDAGRTWGFVEGAELNAGNVRELLPDFPPLLSLPTVGRPEPITGP